MKIILKFIGVLTIACVAGCSTVGMFSKTEQFSGTETFEIVSPKKDILEVIAAVGEDMGMEVAKIDQNFKMVTLSTSSSTAALYLNGSQSRASITASVKNEGKSIDVSYSTSGNYGNGGRSASTKLMEEFKVKLANKLGQKLVNKGTASSQPASSIVGTPAPQSKFSKLQLGMSVNQVKSLIGESKDCVLNPRDVINFSISGYDCPYKGEGMLIFDWNRQALFRVVVDTNMGDFRPIQN
jgi:hypothetical protein